MKQKELEQYTNNLVFRRTQGCINMWRECMLSTETKIRLDQNNQTNKKAVMRFEFWG